jgi:enamine deaminase RidA (YjgF/YER057c/UK114 family)
MTEPISEETAESRLAALGLQLPEPPTPVATYRPFTTAGDLVFTAGVLPVRDGQVITGRLGETLTVEEGIDAARQAALSVLASLARAADGLERIKGVMMLTVYVRSAPDFQRQPEVADGASKLLVAVLGERGEHSRVAVGVSELPREACLEIQVIARH